MNVTALTSTISTDSSPQTTKEENEAYEKDPNIDSRIPDRGRFSSRTFLRCKVLRKELPLLYQILL